MALRKPPQDMEEVSPQVEEEEGDADQDDPDRGGSRHQRGELVKKARSKLFGPVGHQQGEARE